jgi:hypothetical protein
MQGINFNFKPYILAAILLAGPVDGETNDDDDDFQLVLPQL